jgi:glycosyltransferase involved in cell wall biosynthesis
MLFSIIIPLYNKADTIVDTLNSLACQRFKDFEIIVVDDGSTDGGGKLVEQYKGLPVNYRRIPNSGVSIARNFGIEQASATYVVFLDADDRLEPNHLELIAYHAEQNCNPAIISTSYKIFEKRKYRKPKNAFRSGYIGIVRRPYYRMARALSMMNSSTTTVMRSVLVGQLRFPEQATRGEDLYLWIKLLDQYSLLHINIPTVIVNRDAGERSASKPLSEVPIHITTLLEMISSERRLYKKWDLYYFFIKTALAISVYEKRRGNVFLLEWLLGNRAVNNLKIARIIFMMVYKI